MIQDDAIDNLIISISEAFPGEARALDRNEDRADYYQWLRGFARSTQYYIVKKDARSAQDILNFISEKMEGVVGTAKYVISEYFIDWLKVGLSDEDRLWLWNILPEKLTGHIYLKELAEVSSESHNTSKNGSKNRIIKGMRGIELIIPGEDVFILSRSPLGHDYGVVFTDNRDIGEFSICSFGKVQNQVTGINDIILIYIVEEWMYRGIENQLEITWSGTAEEVLLKINDKPMALYDFSAMKAYSNTGLPGERTLSKPYDNHSWEEKKLENFI